MIGDKEIGAAIMSLRRTQDLTQADLLDCVRAMGISWTRVTLSRIESGLRSLKAFEVPALAQALGVGVADLFAGQSDREAVLAARLADASRAAIAARAAEVAIAKELSALRSAR